MLPLAYSPSDVHRSPFIVFYEVTRACDFACRHCRACAQPKRHAKELRLDQVVGLLNQLTEFPKPPTLVLTGGDPMKRPDLEAIAATAHRKGLRVGLSPSATPLVSVDRLQALKRAGVGRIALSLDGAEAGTHDGFRGVAGIYDRTLELIRTAGGLGLSVQINTTVHGGNLQELDRIAQTIAGMDVALWALFFLVNVGRGRSEQRIEPQAYEEVFERLWGFGQRHGFAVKTTEAHHYRRFVLQRGGNPQSGHANGSRRPAASRAPLGISDGKGVMFISHTGEVYPSGFLPLACGRFPDQSVVDVYQNAPLMKSLREPNGFGGKCGRCEYRQVCGGSRARAYATTGDPLAAEPDCVYEPLGA